MADLKSRIAALKAEHTKSAPSLMPKAKAKREFPVEPPPPDIRELVPDPVAQAEWLRLTADYLAMSADERELRLAKQGISDRLKDLCNNYGVTKAMVEDVRVSYFTTSRSSIKKELLLNEGVSPSIIAKATVTTQSQSIRISAPNSQDEED